MVTLDNHYLSVSLGTDANGSVVHVDLTEHAFVVGMPGSGAGNTIQTLIRGVADKPYVELQGIDPYLDLDPWKLRFSSLAKTDTDAVTLLTDLESRFEARAGMLARERSKRVGFASFPPSDDVPFIIVVVPELGLLPDEARKMVAHLVARGRYVGIFFILGGLGALMENSTVRDLIGNRIAHALQNEVVTQRVFSGAAPRVEPHRLHASKDRGVGYFASVGEAGRFSAPRLSWQDAQAFAVMTRPLVPRSLM